MSSSSITKNIDNLIQFIQSLQTTPHSTNIPTIDKNENDVKYDTNIKNDIANENFYLTTAINYTNGPPHIGHAYEGIVSDIIVRYHRIFGRTVFFLTGTDEHGQKVIHPKKQKTIILHFQIIGSKYSIKAETNTQTIMRQKCSNIPRTEQKTLHLKHTLHTNH